MTNAKKLRKAIAEDKWVVAPGAYDAFTVALAENAGFKVGYVGGYSLAASITRTPDLGLITQTEMLNAAINVVNAVDIPIICDIDQGFGSLTNFVRTIHAYEMAGVAAVHFEDQPFPKKCAMMAGRTVIPIEENVKKIKAAVETRNDPDFMLIARTDAQAVEGLDGVLRRLDAYLNAGVDYGLIAEYQNEEELVKIAEAFPGKVAAFVGDTYIPAWHLPFSYYGELGYPLMINCVNAISTAHKYIKAIYQDMMVSGKCSLEYTEKHCCTLAENNAVSRIDYWNGLRAKYNML